VHEILTRYAGGESCQRIAADLNRRGIIGPRGGTWSVSALYGAPAKGAGILNNRLYVGEVVWNRSQWIKDPDTGKRVRMDRPRQEWQATSAPNFASSIRRRGARCAREWTNQPKGRAADILAPYLAVFCAAVCAAAR
jgi:hypothetical protein